MITSQSFNWQFDHSFVTWYMNWPNILFSITCTIGFVTHTLLHINVRRKKKKKVCTIVCNKLCLKEFTHWVPMGFLFWFFAMDFCFLDSNGWILDSDWLDFGFRWDLGWIQIDWFGLTWWCGGGVAVTVVGHVWSSWVIVVGLFGRRWSLCWVCLVVVGPGGSVLIRFFFAHCIGLI